VGFARYPELFGRLPGQPCQPGMPSPSVSHIVLPGNWHNQGSWQALSLHMGSYLKSPKV
jgi:hypothetical protein